MPESEDPVKIEVTISPFAKAKEGDHKNFKVTIPSCTKAKEGDHKDFKVTIAVGITSSHSEQSS